MLVWTIWILWVPLSAAPWSCSWASHCAESCSQDTDEDQVLPHHPYLTFFALAVSFCDNPFPNFTDYTQTFVCKHGQWPDFISESMCLTLYCPKGLSAVPESRLKVYLLNPASLSLLTERYLLYTVLCYHFNILFHLFCFYPWGLYNYTLLFYLSFFFVLLFLNIVFIF